MAAVEPDLVPLNLQCRVLVVNVLGGKSIMLCTVTFSKDL
jgi:hypothetical protein